MEEQNVPQNKIPEDKKLHKIRTFKDDLANAVRSNGVSSAKIAIKEQQRRQKLEQQMGGDKKKSSKVLALIFSFIFLFVALGIFVVLKVNPELSFLNKEKVVVQNEPTPLFEKKTKVVINPGATRPIMVEEIDELSKKGSVGLVQIFDFYTKSGEVEVPATPSEIFNYLHINQENLELSIEKISYGLDEDKPFLLLEINSFDNAFKSMFTWETNRMIDNLETIFPKIRERLIEEAVPVDDVVVNTEEIDDAVVTEEVDEELITNTEDEDTGAEDAPEATVKTTKITWRDEVFVDEILYNKDSRVLRNDDGEVGFAYTFIDNKYLLISSDIRTINKMLELINKFYTENYQI